MFAPMIDDVCDCNPSGCYGKSRSCTVCRRVPGCDYDQSGLMQQDNCYQCCRPKDEISMQAEECCRCKCFWENMRNTPPIPNKPCQMPCTMSKKKKCLRKKLRKPKCKCKHEETLCPLDNYIRKIAYLPRPGIRAIKPKSSNKKHVCGCSYFKSNYDSIHNNNNHNKSNDNCKTKKKSSKTFNCKKAASDIFSCIKASKMPSNNCKINNIYRNKSQTNDFFRNNSKTNGIFRNNIKTTNNTFNKNRSSNNFESNNKTSNSCSTCNSKICNIFSNNNSTNTRNNNKTNNTWPNKIGDNTAKNYGFYASEKARKSDRDKVYKINKLFGNYDDDDYAIEDYADYFDSDGFEKWPVPPKDERLKRRLNALFDQAWVGGLLGVYLDDCMKKNKSIKNKYYKKCLGIAVSKIENSKPVYLGHSHLCLKV